MDLLALSLVLTLDTVADLSAELRAALEANDAERVSQLASDLGAHGADAASAAELLVRALDVAREEAVGALDAIGVGGTRVWIDLALEPTREGQDAGYELARFAPSALAEHSLLIGDERQAVRAWGAALLANAHGGAALVERLLRSHDPTEQLRGLRAAVAFGERSSRCVPLVAPFLGEERETYRRAAAFALGRMMPASEPHLADALEDEGVVVRRIAVEALCGSLWPYVTDPTSDEIAGFAAWHRDAPGSGVDALASTTIVALAARLDDRDEAVRAHAARALWALGGRAAPALPRLRAVERDPSDVVGFWAQRAVERLTARPWDRLRALRDALPQSDALIDDVGSVELAQLVSRMREAERWRPTERGDWGWRWPGEPDERWDAARAIVRRALPALLAAQGDAGVGTILSELERELDARVATLLRLVDDEFGPGPAQEAMKELGAVVLPALAHDLLRVPRFPIGVGTYDELLVLLEHHGADALPYLVEALGHWSVYARERALHTLLKLGKDAAPAAPFLVSAWRRDALDERVPGSDTFWDRDPNAECLAALGPPALPWLERALDDDLAIVRSRACRNLGAFGAAARRTVPKLLELLRADEPSVRRAAARAILRIAPSDSDAAREARAFDATRRGR